MKTVIIISAHPDDEVLGAGGTLLKHINKGDEVYWLITTNVSIEQGFERGRVESRQIEIKEVEKKIGIKKNVSSELSNHAINFQFDNRYGS